MANNRLPFGLCKKYGIDLPDDATPKDAWEALKENGIEMIEDEEPTVIECGESLFVDSMVSDDAAFVQIEKEALGYIKGRTISTKRESGLRDDILTEIAAVKGFDAPPRRLTNSEIIDSLTRNGGDFWYRGLKEPQHAEAFYDGELWMGQGFFGNGIYMAPDLLEASTYGNSKVVAIVDNDMKIAPPSLSARRKQFLDYLSVKIKHIGNTGTIEQFDEYQNLYNMMTDMGKFAIFSGYDAYRAGKNIVILNRGKLKIGETNEKLEEIAIHNQR